jgi:hypothetical protein
MISHLFVGFLFIVFILTYYISFLLLHRYFRIILFIFLHISFRPSVMDFDIDSCKLYFITQLFMLNIFLLFLPICFIYSVMV